MPERKTLFADIILPIPIRKEFTYRVPYELNNALFAGARVVVPFGRSKLITGIVTSIHENIPTEYQAKFIESVLDEEPIITQEQYTFWKWISSYYMAPIGDVMNAALPANFKLASETKVVLHPDYNLDYTILTEREAEIVSALEIKETLDLKEISELIGIRTIQPVVKALMDKKVVLSLEELNDKFSPKTATFIQLAPEYQSEAALNEVLEMLENKGRTKQVEALMTLLQLIGVSETSYPPILRSELVDRDVSLSSINTLVKHGILHQEKLEISRFDDVEQDGAQFKTLSPGQQQALDEIHTAFEHDKVTLLYGVTGSGKTEIYVQLIQEQLDLGKQVLFLLPEIALTTQLIQRLSIYFGEQIGVYHSRFNQNERVEIWNHVLHNDPNRFRIILGARSSLFLPYRDLGLVIVDEEH